MFFTARIEPAPLHERLTDSTMFPVEDLLPLLTLALGAALALGTGLALVRPREMAKENELATPPLGRSLIQIAIGAFASIWAIATLLT